MDYQILCNYTRHVIIVFKQTPKITEFLAIQPVGVTIEKMSTPGFLKEYYIPLKYTVMEAVLKFLNAAIRGYSFNEQAIFKLKEIIMSDNNSMTKEVNALVEKASKPTAKQEATADKKAEKAAKVKAAKPPKEAKPRGPGIGAFCKELIAAGKTNAEVVDAVAEKFPGSNTKAASIAGYRSQMKKAK